MNSSEKVAIEKREKIIKGHYSQLKKAAVSVVVFPDENSNWQVLLSKRAKINGYNGKAMSQAGNVLLFGGESNAGESPRETALRELKEETSPVNAEGEYHINYSTNKVYPELIGKQATDFNDIKVLADLGMWYVEEGYEVSGFLFKHTEHLDVDKMGYDAREVDGVLSIPLNYFFENKFENKFRPASLRSINGKRFVGYFESPHLDYWDAKTKRKIEIWGVAGFMLSKVVKHYHNDFENFISET